MYNSSNENFQIHENHYLCLQPCKHELLTAINQLDYIFFMLLTGSTTPEILDFDYVTNSEMLQIRLAKR